MRTPATTIHPVPSVPAPDQNGGRALGLRPGQELRTIVKKAVDQRQFLLNSGRSHLTHEQVSMPMVRLRMWLQRNPWPSAATVKAFPYKADVELVMPGNAGCRSLLQDLQRLLN